MNNPINTPEKTWNYDFIFRIVFISIFFGLMTINLFYKIENLWIYLLGLLLLNMFLNKNWFKGHLNKKQKTILITEYFGFLILVVLYIIYRQYL